MPVNVRFSGPFSIITDFDRRALMERGRRALTEARVQVQPVIYAVRDEKDAALRRAVAKVTGEEPKLLTLEAWQWKRDVAKVSRKDRAALEAAAKRLKTWHARQRPHATDVTVEGVRAGLRPEPLASVGIVVPAGCRPLAILACCVPAKLAGVARVVVCAPPLPDGGVDPLLLAASDIGRVDELYTVGGPEAVAALAYGTETIAPVDKIVGTGDVRVQAAKQLVDGVVGVDTLAGPGEIVVVADDRADPSAVAWELACEAEAGEGATCVLLATSDRVVRAVGDALEDIVAKLEGSEAARRALAKGGFLLRVPGLADAVEFVNAFAPRRLVLATEKAKTLLPKVKAAGSVSVGLVPAAVADVVTGTSPVVAGSGAARFASALTVQDFVRFVQWHEASLAALRKAAPLARDLAALEGRTAHAAALEAAGQKGKGR